jgi:hypothetical protein
MSKKDKVEKYSIIHSTPNKGQTIRKYKDIKQRQKQLKSVEFEGMRLRHADIIKKIAFEFYMSETSIELVLLRDDLD